jgi:hypothetical protein
MPDSINASFNQTFETPINITGNATLTIQSRPGHNDSTNLPVIVMQSGVPYLRWLPQSLTPMLFAVVATDTFGQTDIWIPNVHYCACLNGGTCSDVTLTQSMSIYVDDGLYPVPCNCVSPYSGSHCTQSLCDSDASPCDPLVICTIAPGVPTCGLCPSNMQTYNGRCISDYGNPLSPCLTTSCSQICTPNYVRMAATCSCFGGYSVDSIVSTQCNGTLSTLLAKYVRLSIA